MTSRQFLPVDAIPAAARAFWKRGCSRALARFEDLRSRYVWKSLDALLTAPLGQSNSGQHVVSLQDAGSRSYRRAQQIMNALTRLLPRTVAYYRRQLFDPGLLPFAADRVALLSFGSGVTVFLVQAASERQEPRVLKVYRKSLGRRLDGLRTMVQERRATYDRLASWYDDCSVLLPTQFLLLHGPLRSGAVVACVQPFVEGQHTDVFHDVPERTLLELFAKHPRLEAQFRLFVERTLGAVEREGACVDIVGRNNLVITGNGEQCRLVLLDNGFYDFQRKAIRSPAALAELRQRLAYLQRIYEQLPGGDASTPRHSTMMEQECRQPA
jgi:hypothetical protein